MDSKRTKIDKKFKPVAIEITFNFTEEIEMFYSFMNFAPIANLFGINDCSRIRSSLAQKAGDSPYDYNKAFKKLKEAMSNYSN